MGCCMQKDSAASNSIVITYDALEVQRKEEMQRALKKRLEAMHEEEGGRGDSLRRIVLADIVAEQYEQARVNLNRYVDRKTQFPNFQKKAARYVKHCLDLIQAVETKRHFPGLAGLSLSKQQEIHERVVGHFNDLKHFLVQIERIEREQKLDDVRSTVWVLRACCHGVGLILGLAFLMDVSTGLLSSANIVFDSFVTDVVYWFTTRFPM